MKKLFSFLLITTSIFANNITVAVSSNVSYAIKPLIKEFNKTNTTKVRIVLGSSGKLTAQIKHKAPYDIFLSANMKYPNKLFKDKIAIKKPRVYAQGTLALFSAKKRDFIGLSTLNYAKRIAIANPKTAPYGKAAFEALKNSHLLKNNIKKFVYAENIAQTVQYALVGTDLGIIAKASLFSPKMKKYKKNENYIDIDSTSHDPINQGVALLNNKKSSVAFYEFILSPKAKKIFKEYGYNIE